MKKLSLIVILSFFLLCFSSTLYSQESSVDKETIKVGIGISSAFTSISLYSYPSLYSYQPKINTAISVPLIFSSVYKLEPFVSYTTFKSDQKTDNVNSQISNYDFENTYLGIGLGVFYVKNIQKTNLHFGVRAGYIHMTSNTSSFYFNTQTYSEEKGSGFMVTPILGGEYFFSDYFSLGGEAHFEYSNINIDETSRDGSTVYEYTSITFPDYYINEQYFSLYQFHPFSISNEI